MTSEPAPDAVSQRPRAYAGAQRRTTLVLVTTVLLGMLIPNVSSGTIAEQRARLPPAADCSDPVEGVWRSHQFHEGYQEWGIFTLEIHRVPGDPSELTGRISNRSWYGPATMSEPGQCEGRLDYLVTMNARGSFEGGVVTFHGTDWSLDEVYCGSRWGFAYNLDRFSGAIDPEIQEFQSVNNDGGRYIDVPTVFRRVSCFEEAPPTELSVQPPEFMPDLDGHEGGGCLGGRR